MSAPLTKDAMTYANEAGFFSFNVVGWKAEFERLVEAVRADAIADHIRDATKMVAKQEAVPALKDSLTAQNTQIPAFLRRSGSFGD